MEALNLVARPVAPRETAQVQFTNGKGAFEAPIGTILEEYVRAAYPDRWRTIVGAIIDGKLRELTTPIRSDCKVEPIDVSSRDGMRMYRRSLTFLLIVAAHELFPTATIEIDHSLPYGGYYCQIIGRDPLSTEELQTLQARMREIVNANEPIMKARIPLAEARAIFEQQGYDDKLRLLNYRTKDYLTVYTMRGVTDYFYGYMVPSSGYLRTFALAPLSSGFVLQFPRRAHPDQLEKADRPSKLAAVFKRHADHMRVMEVEDVGSLNQA
ncbi:MAG TPA: nucleoside kinase, partial [Anaerolineae bacterium]|nr:nucleoside kinase [Anaerolineae bacterium]